MQHLVNNCIHIIITLNINFILILLFLSCKKYYRTNIVNYLLEMTNESNILI
jgi:hypothetical protein